MTGRMSHETDELEQHLSDQLHGIGGLAPDADGWEGIHHRLDRRRRARTRARVGGVAFVLMAVVAVLIPLAGRGDRRTQVASDPQGFPRLILDLPGYDLVHADSSEDSARRDDTGQLLVYGDAGPGLLGTGEVVFVRLVPAGAPYGIGGDNGTVLVDIAGREGRLLRFSAMTTSLGWTRPDETLVHVVATGVADDALADMGRSIEAALAEGLTPPTELGDGLVLRRTDPQDLGPSRQAEVAYTGPANRSVNLRLTSGGPSRLDDLVVDRLGSAREWTGLVVGGQAAVVSTYDNGPEIGEPSKAVMWAVRPGVVAELVARGLSDAEIESALASIQDVDEAGWDALVAKTRAANRPVDSGPPTAQAQADSAYTTFLTELCALSARWLDAYGAGGTVAHPFARDDAAAGLHSLRDKGQAAGLGQDSDVVVIADRVVAAADADDADAVRAERAVCP